MYIIILELFYQLRWHLLLVPRIPARRTRGGRWGPRQLTIFLRSSYIISVHWTHPFPHGTEKDKGFVVSHYISTKHNYVNVNRNYFYVNLNFSHVMHHAVWFSHIHTCIFTTKGLTYMYVSFYLKKGQTEHSLVQLWY